MSTDYTNYRACDKCATPLKRRARPPYTASDYGKKHFVYYQCPDCKTNYVGITSDGSYERKEQTNAA